MRSRPRRHRVARFALVVLSLATVVGAGTVLGAVDRGDLFPLGGRADKLPVVGAHAGQEDRVRSYKPGDCRDLNASFLDSACHAEVLKRHPGRVTHRVATAVIGHADAREPEPHERLLQGSAVR